MTKQPRADRTNALIFVAVLVAIMWVTEGVDALLGGDLDAYGIHPRDVDGLPEIVSAPFLHAGFDHLISNTLPFLVMGATIALAGFARVALVTLIVAAVSGLGVWLTGGANTVHLGASGIVFGYAAYLVTRGLFSRRAIELIVGAAILGIWGIGLLQGLLPQDRISWQAHLFGAIGGVLAAFMLDRRAQPAPPARAAAA